MEDTSNKGNKHVNEGKASIIGKKHADNNYHTAREMLSVTNAKILGFPNITNMS